MERHMKNRNRRRDPVLMRVHNRGSNQNICNFTNFCRLNIDGDQRNVKPASVTQVITGTEGDQQQQQKGAKPYQHASML